VIPPRGLPPAALRWLDGRCNPPDAVSLTATFLHLAVGGRLFIEKLKGGASSAGRQTEGAPGIILLEQPASPDEPALMILYVVLAAQEVKISL